jgi:ribonuclease HI
MTIEIYTDGACRLNNLVGNQPGSWAVNILKNNKLTDSFGGYEKSTTNNQMELMAILNALQYVEHNNIKDEVIIYSDSAYCINAINMWMDGWNKRNWKNVKNLEILKLIYILKNKLNNIKYIHIRGHSGNYGNELADKLCNSILDEMSGAT